MNMRMRVYIHIYIYVYMYICIPWPLIQGASLSQEKKLKDKSGSKTPFRDLGPLQQI